MTGHGGRKMGRGALKQTIERTPPPTDKSTLFEFRRLRLNTNTIFEYGHHIYIFDKIFFLI